MKNQTNKLKTQFATFLWRASICLAPNFVWLMPDSSVGWSTFVSAFCVALFTANYQIDLIRNSDEFEFDDDEKKGRGCLLLILMSLILFGVVMAI